MRSPSKYHKLSAHIKSSIDKPIMESKGQNWTNIAIDEDVIIDLEEDGVSDKKKPNKNKNLLGKFSSMSRVVQLKSAKIKTDLLLKHELKSKKIGNSSVSIDKTAKTNAKKKKKMPALNSLVPINLFEERKIFYDKSANYNPVFNYPQSEVDFPVI